MELNKESAITFTFRNLWRGILCLFICKDVCGQNLDHHFAEDPLSRASGERLWRNMLGYGVSRPPKVILKDVLGGVLNPKHYYRAIGAAEK